MDSRVLSSNAGRELHRAQLTSYLDSLRANMYRGSRNISLSRNQKSKGSKDRNTNHEKNAPLIRFPFFMSPSALYLPEATHSVPIKKINTGPTVYPERKSKVLESKRPTRRITIPKEKQT